MKLPQIDRTRALTIYPIGGLGNQLFIYACGRTLADRLRIPLQIDVGWFQHQSLRACELNEFRSGAVIRQSAWASYAAGKLISHIGSSHIRSIASFGNWILEAPDDSFASFSHRVEPGAHLLGYFQSWKFFDSSAVTVRSEILDARSPSQWCEITSQRLSEFGKWTSVHLRRGDYLAPNNLKIHGVLDTSYYHRAIEKIEAIVGVRPLIVFSDEVSEAHQLLRSLKRDGVVIEQPPGSSGYESLILMAQASSSIIANSSFSWWGAWLGTPHNDATIYPARWFADSTREIPELIPQGWISES